MRRAKAHLRRQDPVGGPGLAVARIFRKNGRGWARFRENAKERERMEDRLGEDDCLPSLHHGHQRGAALAFFAVVLMGTVRRRVGMVRMMSLGVVRVMSSHRWRVLYAGGMRFMRNFLAGAQDRFAEK